MKLMSWSRGRQLGGQESRVQSALQWKEWLAALCEGSQRAQEPVQGDRASPRPLGSPLIALGHTGREEGWAWMECGKGCNAGACNDERAVFFQRCDILY